MADFCYKCVEETFEVPGDRNDLRGLCDPGYAVAAICEGCGPGWFDHEGKRVGVDTPDIDRAAAWPGKDCDCPEICEPCRLALEASQ